MTRPEVNFTEEYLLQYDKINPFKNPLSQFVFLRTYSRWLEKEKRRETWLEVCLRCVKYSFSLYSGPATQSKLQQEANEFLDKMFNLKVLPAGRTLWCGGTKSSENHPTSQFNCAFTTINKISDFKELFYLMMLGSGVGFSTEKKYVSDLPIFRKDIHLAIKDYEWCHCPSAHEETFIFSNPQGTMTTMDIGDSREGWADGLQKFIELFQDKKIKDIIVDVDSVRPQGSRLKTFGGKASGPEPYTKMLKKIHKIISNAPELDDKPGWIKLRPIDVLDICNIAGEAVVAGGVRRSSQIDLMDEDDYLSISAKKEYWNNPNTQHRNMSNNSIAFKSKPTFEYLMNLKDSIKESYEPGMFNMESGSWRRPWFLGFNPCQPESAELLTKNGITRMKNINIGDKIWSENGWVSVTNKWSTGVKKINKYNTTAGYFLGTENHKIISNGLKVEVGESESIDKLRGPVYGPDAGIIFINPKIVMDGLVLGDGSVHMTSKEKVYLIIGEKDHDYLDSEISHLIFESHAVNHKSARKIETSIDVGELPKTYNRVIPDRFYLGNKEIVCSFLRGLYTANGSVNSDRICLKGSSKRLIEQVRNMLSSVGIFSYITTNKTKMCEFSNGTYQIKESYDLNIRQIDDYMRFSKNIGFIQKYKNKQMFKVLSEKKSATREKQTFDIKSIEYIGEEEVYDITVDGNNHTYWTAGLNVSNCGEILLANKGFCNLSTTFINQFVVSVDNKSCIDFESLSEVIKISTRHCMRITNVNVELPEWDAVQKRDRLLGVSVTGWEDTFDACLNTDREIEKFGSFGNEIIGDQRIINVFYEPFGGVVPLTVENFKSMLRNVAQNEATLYAHEMRIPRPLLVTTLKPEGTQSQLTVCSSGFHKSFAPFYIRRVRVNSFDAVAKTVKAQGYKIYPETAKGWTKLNKKQKEEVREICSQVGIVVPDGVDLVDLANSKVFDLCSDELQESVLKKADTWVVEFVVKTSAKSRASDEPATEQLKRYFSYQKNWTEHNTSATIQVADDEWEDLFKMLYDNWDDYIGVSFQNKSNDKYDLTPYEAIEEEEYLERLKRCPDIDVNLLTEIEGNTFQSDDLIEGCSTGSCPSK